ADGVLIPAVGTVPGVREEIVAPIVSQVKARGGLVISTIGTSQESADSQTVREFGLSNKRVGSDIHHIGDGSYGRMPDPENILALSLAVRGKRHTYFKMGQSVRR
ncbi:TPA: haloacid dehalogenase-like hydrolase, partial [Streptococcus suis]|nr:haloacid dehalogenase-like hydrolase [Streptococcus suis]